MKELSLSAQECIDFYMQKVKARLRGAKTLDANEVECDIQEHIERELEGEVEPVGNDAVAGVLDRLGSPEQWVPDEELSWWRKIIVRMQNGPDDWRLAYISFGLFVVGFVMVPFCIIFLLLSVYIARSALSIAGGPKELGASRMLIFPQLIVFYLIVGLVLLLWPIPPLVILTDTMAREMTNDYFQSARQYWLMALGLILAVIGLWWSAVAGFLLCKQPFLNKLIYPFGDRVTRKKLWKLMTVGVILIISGGIAGLLIIMKFGHR